MDTDTSLSFSLAAVNLLNPKAGAEVFKMKKISLFMKIK